MERVDAYVTYESTPSLETWLNAEGGKYGRAVLAERYGDARPPEIFVSDTIRAAKNACISRS